MRQPSMQNLPNDFAPTKQTPKKEGSDRLLPQPESDSTKTSSVRPSQAAIDTSTNTELFLTPTSQDLTIVQITNPTKVENDDTIAQIPSNPSHQDSSMSIGSRDSVPSSSQKTVLAEQIDCSSQHTQIREATNLTQDTIAQFPLQDDSENLKAAEITIVQDHNNTITQHSDSLIHNITDRTVVQHSDSAVHHPPKQKIDRVISPLSTSLAPKILQSGRQEFSHSSTSIMSLKNRGHIQPFHPSILRNVFSTSGSLVSRLTNITGQFFNSIWGKIDPKRSQYRFRLDRQLTGGKTLKQLSANSPNPSTYKTIALDEQPSSEQYQKKLRELDICRLDFAKELARNGKFRQAIAVAEQISEMSSFFKDAQMLIQSWKQF